MTLEYAKEREQFGRPMGTFQASAHRLADIQCEVEAARALVWKAIWLVENNQDEDTLRIVTTAKLFAAEAFVKAATWVHKSSAETAIAWIMRFNASIATAVSQQSLPALRKC